MMIGRSVLWVALGIALASVSSTPASAASLKLATLVPEGSLWDKDLREMGDQWKRKTRGRVSLRIYAGGVAGSESDILRKMRIGQLHAAALTVIGLEQIDPAFAVLSMPLFYDSFEEYLYVLDALSPKLEKKLQAKGYVLLHWVHGGWVRFFSRAPVHGIEDLRKQKIYVTAGADEMVSMWRENGFRPVPLAQTDIMTGFQTGMIDVLPTTPLAALSLQWFRQASYMQEVGLAPFGGATIVKLRDWNKITAEDREILLADASVAEQRQRQTIPEQDQVAIEEMSERGLVVTPMDESPEWDDTATRLVESMRGRLVPQDFYDAAKVLRDEYRSMVETGADAPDEPGPDPTLAVGEEQR
jgi:TRAP-type C4-dicarboxylate transport system substrate-binding protein